MLFSGDNAATQAVQNILRLVGGNGAKLLQDASSKNLMPQQPIVIHNMPPAPSESITEKNGWRGELMKFAMGAGACWASYVVFSQLLPESLKELLPVTRQFFDQAVTSLGQGIIRVRDVLSEQIAALGLKQDELSAKQDSTLDSVNGLKKDIGDVRLNIDDIAIAISRCESSLTDASGRQTYMSRGIRLLVQCVGDLLRNSNPTVADELDQFSRLSEELDGEFHYRESGSNNSRTSNGTPLKRSNMHYPSSPKISEIGSVSEIEMDDVAHMHLGPSHGQTPPPVSGAITPSPSPFMQSPPLMGGKSPMLSMRSMSISRQGSCPENEVPASEKDSFVPLDEVDQLLATIRAGAI